MLSVVLAGTMLVGISTGATGCIGGKKAAKTVTLDVYSQLANFSGMQSGWIADIIKEKFNAKLNIIPNGSGVFQTRMQDGNLGDIVIWGSDADDYSKAVKNNLLYNWNEDNLLKEEGPHIYKNMKDAIAKNSELTKSITDGKSDAVYGIGDSVATTNEDHQMFF